MNWFESFATLAKEAQRKIDKVLDIQEDELEATGEGSNQKKINLSTENVDEQQAKTYRDPGNADEMESNTFCDQYDGSQEMITTPPKMSEKAKLNEELTSTPPISDRTEFLVDMAPKKQFLVCTIDSIDMSSTHETELRPNEATTTACTESIVIIDRANEEEKPDPVISNTTNTKELENLLMSEETSPQGSCSVEIPNQNVNKLEHSYNEETVPYELQAIDSDSTQSFEDLHCSASGDKLVESHCSPPNSNDSEETATSSDIEIISNPRSSTSNTTRTSPLKLDKKTEEHSVECSISATATFNQTIPIRKGHCREPSEISILSMDESQSDDEIEKLVKRISELNSIVEARELKLLQSERQNSILQERINELETLANANNLQSTDEYTKRVSSLEKKFQNCIRERDTLRLQIKDLLSKIPKNDINEALTDSQNMVAELRREGEKLSKEILQQSNIIKKLRAKEKSTDNELKALKEQFQSSTEEMERLKKTLAAKEEVERTQIEVVHKMTSENQRLDKDNLILCGKLEDSQQKCLTLQSSFDAVKAELQQRSKQHSDLSRTAENVQTAEKEKAAAQAQNKELHLQLNELRDKLRSTEQISMKREQQLREEISQLMARVESAELRAESSTQEISQSTIPLMRHLESLQQTLTQRTSIWNQEEKALLEKLEISQKRLKLLENVEETSKEKIDLLKARCQELEESLSQTFMKIEETKINMQIHINDKNVEFSSQLNEINQELALTQAKLKELEDSKMLLEQKLNEYESKFNSQREYQQREETTNSLNALQSQNETVVPRAHSPASVGVNSLEDGLGGSIDWQQDDLDCISNSGRQTMQNISFHYLSQNTSNFEYLQSMLKQRDGELTQCQWELTRLQGERNVLQEELSNISLEMETLKDKMNAYEMMEINFDELQTRYDALLQMFGEKVERCEELQLDLKECKEAYKVQIQELLSKLRT